MSFPTRTTPSERQPSEAPTASAVCAHVQTVLKEHGGALTGTALATAIRNRFPGFDYKTYGTYRLREFLTKHAAPDIAVVGRQGLDILIDIKTTPALSSAEKKPDSSAFNASGPAISEETNVYRAFTSPNSGDAVTIEVNRQSGAWRSVAPGTPVQGEWAVIPPIAADEHREIAREFLLTQPPDVQDLLRGIVEQSSRDWWLRLRQAFRAHRAVEESFVEFRLKAIRTRLESALAKNGVDAMAIPTAVEKATARALRSRTRASGFSSRLLTETLKKRQFDSFHHLALQILAALPENELRDLRVRLGDVYAALHEGE